MKKIKSLLRLVIVTSVIAPFIGFASAAEVRWTNVEEYTDILAAEENKSKFVKQTFSGLERHFTKLENKLPEGYTLKVNVFDLNLAGGVTFKNSRKLRLYTAGQSAAILFKYQVTNEKGKVVSQGTERLSDINFLVKRNARYSSQDLKYERILLDEWFEEKLEVYVSN